MVVGGRWLVVAHVKTKIRERSTDEDKGKHKKKTKAFINKKHWGSPKACELCGKCPKRNIRSQAGTDARPSRRFISTSKSITATCCTRKDGLCVLTNKVAKKEKKKQNPKEVCGINNNNKKNSFFCFSSLLIASFFVMLKCAKVMLCHFVFATFHFSPNAGQDYCF